MFISLDDAQTLLGGDRSPAPSSQQGMPTAPINGLRVMTRDEARTDLLRPLQNAAQSIDFVKVLLWIVAACIIGSIVYLSAMERTRDFAVFKATGTSNGALGGGLALQAVVLSIAAAVLACGDRDPARAVLPTSRRDPDERVPVCCSGSRSSSGLLASLAGLRRAVKVEPAARVRRSVMSEAPDLRSRRHRPHRRVHRGRLRRAAARQVQPPRARRLARDPARPVGLREDDAALGARAASSRRRPGRSRHGDARSPASRARRSPSTAATAWASCSRRSTSCRASTRPRT